MTEGSHLPLGPFQCRRYAALDAYAGLVVWAALMRLPLRRRALLLAQPAGAKGAAADLLTQASGQQGAEGASGDCGAASGAPPAVGGLRPAADVDEASVSSSMALQPTCEVACSGEGSGNGSTDGVAAPADA